MTDIPDSGGTFTVLADGEVFNINTPTFGPITINGAFDFTVNVNRSLNGNLTDNGVTMTFGPGSNVTVNVASGVDMSPYRMDPNGDSITVNIGNDATIGDIDADGVTGVGNTFVINAGDRVTVNGYLDGQDSTAGGRNMVVNFGTDAQIDENIVGATSSNLTLNFGDRAQVDGLIRGSTIRTTGGSTQWANYTFGSDAVIGGSVQGAISDDTEIVFGDRASVTGSVVASTGAMGGSGVQTITFGNTANVSGDVWAPGNNGTAIIQGGNDITVGGDVRTGASSSIGFAQQTISFGDNADIGENIFIQGSGQNKTLILGNGASVGRDINMGLNRGPSIVKIGDNLSVGRNVVGTSQQDNFTIGNNWAIGGNLDLSSGDDELALGFQSDPAVIPTPTLVTGSTGNDGITVTAPPAELALFRTAALAAGWIDNGDGTFSSPAEGAGTNAENIFEYLGVRYSDFEGPGNPICFAAGTQIEVADGETVAVEDLQQGDLVMTADNGLQPVRWIGVTTLTAPADNMCPIRIAAGALGDGLPAADLVVSPQHRMLVRSKIAQRMFGQDEVLVAAKHLLALDGIDVIADCNAVTYVHFLCDRHEVVFANGAASESLFTGPQALKSVSPAAVAEIMTLFPELADVDHKALSARVFAGGRKGRQLAARHKANGRPLLASCH